MTAPAISPVTSALPGLAGGGNGQAAGPLAGFEALLAALFGEADIAGVTGGSSSLAPAAPMSALAGRPPGGPPVAAPLFASFEDPAARPETPPAEIAAVGEDAADALPVPDALLALAAAPPAQAPAVAETTAAAPDAGQPAVAASQAMGQAAGQ